MAFEKRTWLARLGTGLNKFLIGDKGADGKQTLTNSPDTVVQEGDVISADNLNDLEERIEAGFNELETQTQTALAGMKLTKIWENPNPTATNFLAQDISLGNVGNELVIGFAESSVSTGNILFYHLRTNYSVGTKSFCVTHISITSVGDIGSLHTRERHFSAYVTDDNTVLGFDVCKNFTITTDGNISKGNSNNWLIPVIVYKVGDIYNS